MSSGSQNLPLKVYEPIVEIKDRQPRTLYIEVPNKIETGEAERIAVDWTARGGEGGGSCEWFISMVPVNDTDDAWPAAYASDITFANTACRCQDATHQDRGPCGLRCFCHSWYVYRRLSVSFFKIT